MGGIREAVTGPFLGGSPCVEGAVSGGRDEVDSVRKEEGPGDLDD